MRLATLGSLSLPFSLDFVSGSIMQVRQQQQRTVVSNYLPSAHTTVRQMCTRKWTSWLLSKGSSSSTGSLLLPVVPLWLHLTQWKGESLVVHWIIDPTTSSQWARTAAAAATCAQCWLRNQAAHWQNSRSLLLSITLALSLIKIICKNSVGVVYLLRLSGFSYWPAAAAVTFSWGSSRAVQPSGDSFIFILQCLVKTLALFCTLLPATLSKVKV